MVAMTTTNTKPNVSFTTRNGAKVEAFLLSNERYSRSYEVRVNGTKVAVLTNRGRGRYTWPSFDAYANGQSFFGSLRDSVDTIAGAARDYHADGCPSDWENQRADGGEIDWDAKCSCGTSADATALAKEANDPKAARARRDARDAKIQSVKDARRAAYPAVRAALVKALGVTADEDDDPTVDEDEGIVWLYHQGLVLNDRAVTYDKVEISFTQLAKILGIDIEDDNAL
jgi:hypothetical protein